MDLCYSKTNSSLQTKSVSISGNLVQGRVSGPLAALIRRYPDDSHAHYSLGSTGIYDAFPHFTILLSFVDPASAHSSQGHMNL